MYVFRLPKLYSVPKVRCSENPPIKARTPSTFCGERQADHLENSVAISRSLRHPEIRVYKWMMMV